MLTFIVPFLFYTFLEIRIQIYGAQNEVYNDDWAENGLIVLCFS